MSKPLQSPGKAIQHLSKLKLESLPLKRIQSLLANPQLSASQRKILLNILKANEANESAQEGV